MSSDVEFWVDPGCPWCWVTARWVVDEVVPQRGITVTWRPISLLFLNQPAPGSDYHRRVVPTHRMLRVMEAIRADRGDAAVLPWYLYCGTKIHHDGDRGFDLRAALTDLDLDPDLAFAADDDALDEAVRTGMDAGVEEPAGSDVGTPIIAFTNSVGERRGIFGPVLTRVPEADEALRVWDAVEAFATMDGFWELSARAPKAPPSPPASPSAEIVPGTISARPPDHDHLLR